MVYQRELDPVPIPSIFIMGGKAGVFSYGSVKVPHPLSDDLVWDLFIASDIASVYPSIFPSGSYVLFFDEFGGA